MTTSENVAEWRRMCGEIEAQDHCAVSNALRYCTFVALFAFVVAVPLLCVIGAAP